MGIRRAKVIYQEGEEIKTMTKPWPVFQPSHQNPDVLRMEVGQFKKRLMTFKRKHTVCFPAKELTRPSVVITCAHLIAKEQTRRLEETKDKLEIEETKLARANKTIENLQEEVKMLGTNIEEQVTERTKAQLAVLAEYQKAQKPIIKGGRI